MRIVEICRTLERNTFEVNSTSSRGPGVDPALGWSGLVGRGGWRGDGRAGGDRVAAAAGGSGRADRGLVGCCGQGGFHPAAGSGRALTDATCALAAGASCLSDIEAMTAQVEIFGPGGGASDTTMLRVLNELADRLGADGLPGRKLAKAMAG